MENIDWGWLLFNFDGRINRAKFWIGIVILWAANAILVAIASAANSSGVWALVGLVSLVLIWPSLAVSIKRWHDRGKSGWWVLIALIPFIGEAQYVPMGPAEMALRCGSAVVTGFSIRLPDGTTRVEFKRLPVDDAPSPEWLAFRIGREIERHLLLYPEQWFWIFRQNPVWPGGQGAPSAEEFERSLARAAG